MSELEKYLPRARVLLADHGKLNPQDDLEKLADKLLKQLLEKRQSTVRGFDYPPWMVWDTNDW